MAEQPEPEFLAPLENHTVTQGRDVHFTCVVNHLSSYKVAWIKSDTKAILAIHTHMVAQNPRLSVTHNGHNTWMLRVYNVQKNDSGSYMCQINTDPMRSQVGPGRSRDDYSKRTFQKRS
jgi:neurotrimin